MRSRFVARTCRLAAVADGGVPVCRTAFSYDAKGLLVGETNPRGGTSQIVRDANGFPVSVTTADGVTTESEYDEGQGGLSPAWPSDALWLSFCEIQAVMAMRLARRSEGMPIGGVVVPERTMGPLSASAE